MFVNWAEQQLENDSDFLSKNRLQLNGFVNKQNLRYSSDSNPHVLHLLSLHPEKLRFGAIYGPAASLGRTSFVMIKTGTLL